MGQPISDYEVELGQLTRVMKKLEQTLLSTKQQLKEEVGKNQQLEQEFQQAKAGFSVSHSTENHQLQLAMEQLEIEKNQSRLFREELEKTRERLNQTIAENHQLNLTNQHLQEQGKNQPIAFPSFPAAQTKEESAVPIERSKSVKPTITFSTNEEKIRALEEKLAQQKEETERLKQEVSHVDEQMFSKDEVAELFLQAKVFAKELESKKEEERQVEACKASLDREKEQLYEEWLSIAEMNQQFISRLNQLKAQENQYIKDTEDD